jgi:RNA recognition motif-containing protein
MASKLYVGGLAYATTSESLRQYFAQCGTVESATINHRSSRLPVTRRG